MAKEERISYRYEVVRLFSPVVSQLWGLLVQSFPPLDTMSIKIKFCSILQTIQITAAKI